jgi:hypothetical protein
VFLGGDIVPWLVKSASMIETQLAIGYAYTQWPTIASATKKLWCGGIDPASAFFVWVVVSIPLHPWFDN